MPELGKYAAEVLAAYAVSLTLLLGLVLVSWRRHRAAQARLAAVEAKRNG